MSGLWLACDLGQLSLQKTKSVCVCVCIPGEFKQLSYKRVVNKSFLSQKFI